MWASPTLAGAVHDVRAAREPGIIQERAEAGIDCGADKCYQGAGGRAKIRALVEQAIATLKSWRLLRKLRCSTTRITSLVQAVLCLHLAGSN